MILMKKAACILGLMGALAGAVRAADERQPVVIEGLEKNVHRAMGMTKAWAREGQMDADAVTRLLQAIRHDEVVSEAEARLLAALGEESFFLRIPEQVFPDGGKALEVVFAGALTAPARKVLAEEEQGFEVLWRGLKPENGEKLALLLQRSSSRRAEGRAHLLQEIEQALNTPDTDGKQQGAYRALVAAWEEWVQAVGSPITRTVLRGWLYEALLLHDRQNPGVVKSFMYGWIKPEDYAARKRAEDAVEALLAEKKTP